MSCRERDGAEHLHIQIPYTCVPLFKVLADWHAKVVQGPPSCDGVIHIMTLEWSKACWPDARIVSCEHMAEVTDVCTSPALAFIST